MAKQFRKKPVVIEAVQWTGDNIREAFDFLKWRNASHDQFDGLALHTLEGTMAVPKGNWIIKGVRGEYYSCDPDIFKATYEAVDG